MSLIQLFAIGNGNTGDGLPVMFAAVYGLGFLAAVVGGSLAWYNSKRPAGWEGSERPSYIPKINTGSDDSQTVSEETDA